VENLWMIGAYPVDKPTERFFFNEALSKMEMIAFVDAFSYVASLDRKCVLHRIELAPKTLASSSTTVNLAVHRFEESIGGRSYVIEVKSVDTGRWRADIVRIPGLPTAMMPFYGPTPADAAHELSKWLTKAYERVSKPGGSV
jgi:hypothetical protein